MKQVAVTSRSFAKHPLLRRQIAERYPNVTFNDTGKTLADEELINFLKGHEKALIGLERINANVLKHLPELRTISRFGVGLDTLDLNALKEHGVKLAYTAGANKRSVAELVIAFALIMLRNLGPLNGHLKQGIWQSHKGRQLTNACVGIIGLGAIGKDLASLLKSFNCKMLCYDVVTHDQQEIEQVSLEKLLTSADIISLHLPLNNETKHIINSERLNLMKPNALLINTARGGLVDEDALYEVLKTNKIAGAAFDVFAQEPCVDSRLLSLANFFATPHIGGSTEEAIIAMGKAAIDGLENAKLLG